MANLGRFRTDIERDYYAERQAYAESLDRKVLIDAPFLLATRQAVSEMAVRYELFKLIHEVSGAIVECGVARGNNLLLFSHLSSVFEPYAINRRIVGFDTFDGFRSMGGRSDPTDISERDFADTSETAIRKAIELANMNRAAGHMERTDIVRGDAVETIPAYVASHAELTVALLYLDFDLYEPTRVALKTLLPLVCRGGIVAFDEFNYDKFAGETAALKDVLDVNKIALKRFPFDPFVAYFQL
jgi:Macrocin-O-methyltransferase (TylF)